MIEPLQHRLERALGRPIATREDLAGFFSRYRPDGAGIDAVLDAQGLDGEVRRRLLDIFAASAPGANPGDCYFVVRRPPPISRAAARDLTARHLSELRAIANFSVEQALSGCSSTARMLERVEVGESDGPPDEGAHATVYDCLTDFISDVKYKRSPPAPLFLLDEAIYTMASDHGLKAYVLWPVIQSVCGIESTFDAALDLWAHGLDVAFVRDGTSARLIAVPRARK